MTPDSHRTILYTTLTRRKKRVGKRPCIANRRLFTLIRTFGSAGVRHGVVVDGGGVVEVVGVGGGGAVSVAMSVLALTRERKKNN